MAQSPETNSNRSSDSNFLVALFTDKTFQAREIRRVIFLAGLYLVITTVLVGIFYHMILGKLIAGAAPLFFVSEDMELFNESLPGLTSVIGRWVLAMMVINVIVTAGIATYIVRKLGHPILAIKRALNDIGNGDLNVQLRASDSKEFGEISDSLNVAVERIRKHISEAKNEMSHLQELKNAPAANANDINQALENCHEALNYFKSNDESTDHTAKH